MKNMTRNMSTAGKQSGFTIIELIVVILLLGILTATALPRFIDVTDQAHVAVVDAVEGGFSTGMALFRAQWIADGSPAAGTAVPEFGGIEAGSSGYPIGLDASSTDALGDNTDCLTNFTGLLQPGRPDVGEDPAITTTQAVLSDGTIANALTATPTAEFVAQRTAATVCTYAYVGQYSTKAAAVANLIDPSTGAAASGLPIITVDQSDGTVTRGFASY